MGKLIKPILQILLIGSILSLRTQAFGQEGITQSTDSVRLEGKSLIISEVGFIRLTRNSSLPVTQIQFQEFNAGNIHDPMQLIQGKVSGLLIGKPGNDPNEPFAARLRGVNSIYMSNSPLIIVDGMPFSSMINVDPNDISKITVVKDAAVASQFGLNSMNGAILIETFTGKDKKLSFRNYTAFEIPIDQSDLMLNSSGYIQAGGADLGYSTDWQDEVTRNAFSNVTGISYGDKKGGTEYYGSFNYRNANGILEKSGFKSYNGRASISQSLFSEKLVMSGQFAFTQRKNSFSFPEAFKYARSFIPTSPIYFGSGDYAEFLVFDNFNPVAMIQQNIHDGTTNINLFGFNLSYKVTSTIEVKGGYNRENQKNEKRQYWSKESDWIGEGQNGYRIQDTQNLQSNFWFFSALFSKQFNKTTVSASGNFSFQNLDFEDNELEGENFPTDEIGKGPDFETYPGVNWSQNHYQKNHGITSYRVAFSSNTSDQLFIDANLCKEAFSDNLKGITYGLAAAFDFAAKNQRVFTTFKTKLGFGKTAGGMAFFQNYNPENLLQSWRSITETDINPEQKTELTVGIDWGIKNVSGSINFFRAKTKDVLMLDNTNTLTNHAQIQNSGVEIDLRWAILNKERFQLVTSLNISTIKNKLLTSDPPQYLPGLEYVLYHGTIGLHGLENNKPVGLAIGYDHLGFVNNYEVINDKNGDGSISTQDYITFGQPLPDCFVGWTTNMKAGRWSASVMFRGAFGHKILNANRMAYEQKYNIPNYNATTSISKPPLESADLYGYGSDFHMENGSYVKLDNLSVSYDLFVPNQNRFTCTINLTVQNLFTITGYSGATPEVRMDYYGIQYAAGFDSQYTYYPSRTFLLGLHFNL